MTAALINSIEKFTITTKDKSRTLDVLEAVNEIRILKVLYREHINSPYFRGQIILASSSGAIASEDDRQNRSSALLSGLPLLDGCIISLRIRTKRGVLNFSQDDGAKLYVNKVTTEYQNSTSEMITIDFVSRVAMINGQSFVTSSFDGKISNSVREILRAYLDRGGERVEIDESSNNYIFYGNQKRPSDIILELLPLTIPSNIAEPGYYFFETKSKLKFVSVYNMINSPSNLFAVPYTYNGVNISSSSLEDDSNDFKVYDFKVKSEGGLMEKIRTGVYATKNVFFNPRTFEFKEIDISVSADPKFTSLGEKEKIPSIVRDGFSVGRTYHKITTNIFDVGANNESTDINNSPELYASGAEVRYNTITSRVYDVHVSCNIELEAGMRIKLNVESRTDNKEMGSNDVSHSGEYIIQGLTHYFDYGQGYAITSMRLIRDSYNLHFTRGN